MVRALPRIRIAPHVHATPCYYTADPPTIHLNPESWRATSVPERRVRIAAELAVDRLGGAYRRPRSLTEHAAAHSDEHHANWHAQRTVVTDVAVLAVLSHGEIDPAAAAERWLVPEWWAIERLGSFRVQHRTLWDVYTRPGSWQRKARWLLFEYLPGYKRQSRHRTAHPDCPWPPEALPLLCAAAYLAGVRANGAIQDSPVLEAWARQVVEEYAQESPLLYADALEPLLLTDSSLEMQATPLQRLWLRLWACRVAIASEVLARLDAPWEHGDPWHAQPVVRGALLRVLTQHHPSMVYRQPADAGRHPGTGQRRWFNPLQTAASGAVAGILSALAWVPDLVLGSLGPL